DVNRQSHPHPGEATLKKLSDFTSAESDDLDAQIDAWTQEQLAASPAWSVEKWTSVMAILEPDDRGNPTSRQAGMR
ncbi:hypothetical protein ACFV0W_12845, partial [Streptomyces anulatus]